MRRSRPRTTARCSIANQKRIVDRAAHNIAFFAKLARTLGARADPRPRRRQPRALRAGRRGRADHAVERAADALDVEDRPGARGRQHGRAQATGVGAAVVLAARARSQRTPACRRACSTSCRASARSRAGAGRAPGRRPHQLHRFDRDRPHRRRARAAQTSRPSASSSAASRRSSCSPTPISTKPRARSPRSSATPGRCAWPVRASWSTRRSKPTSARACSKPRSVYTVGDPRAEGRARRAADPPAPARARVAASSSARSTPVRTALIGGAPHALRRPLLPADDPDRRRARTPRSCRTKCSARC